MPSTLHQVQWTSQLVPGYGRHVDFTTDERTTIMAKVQTQLLMAEVTRNRADAIALVRGEPRAEVLRLALEGGGLRGLEKDHAEELARLGELARTMGIAGGPLLAARAAKDGYTLAELEGRKRYPVRK
jgi:hypothetical protein